MSIRGRLLLWFVLPSAPSRRRARWSRGRDAATMSALKTIQDKLAIEANDFQALQKGARRETRTMPRARAIVCVLTF